MTPALPDESGLVISCSSHDSSCTCMISRKGVGLSASFENAKENNADFFKWLLYTVVEKRNLLVSIIGFDISNIISKNINLMEHNIPFFSLL